MDFLQSRQLLFFPKSDTTHLSLLIQRGNCITTIFVRWFIPKNRAGIILGFFLGDNVQDLGLPPWAVFGLIFILLIIIAYALEELSVMIIMLPFLYPLVTGLGFDGILVWGRSRRVA